MHAARERALLLADSVLTACIRVAPLVRVLLGSYHVHSFFMFTVFNTN